MSNLSLNLRFFSFLQSKTIFYGYVSAKLGRNDLDREDPRNLFTVVMTQRTPRGREDCQ